MAIIILEKSKKILIIAENGARSFPKKGQECHVSQRIFEQMLAEVSDEVTVLRGVSRLSTQLAPDKRSIASLSVRDRTGKTLELAGKVFIDASCEPL